MAPLAMVEDGDETVMDIPKRKLDINIAGRICSKA